MTVQDLIDKLYYIQDSDTEIVYKVTQDGNTFEYNDFDIVKDEEKPIYYINGNKYESKRITTLINNKI